MKNKIVSNNVSFQYLHTERPFLRNINIRVNRGECVLICGPSGSGKSTFSRLLNGISPDYLEGVLTGELHIFDLKAGETGIEEYVPVVGSVFQNPTTQHFTVDTTSELAFPLENSGADPDDIVDIIQDKASTFQVENLLDHNIFELSGGEKQQIAFVSATMLSPAVLILDEVTSNLDHQAIKRIRDMIKLLKERGMTIIIMEHRLAWIKGLADRYILFKEGQIANEWPAHFFEQLSNQTLHDFGLRSMDLQVHREKIHKKILEQHRLEDGILRTEKLSVGYPKRTVLTDINLSFKEGETIGLFGPNGIGKTTLANTLTGLQTPLAGRILWDGKEFSNKQRIEKSYMVMQNMNYQLFSDSVVDEILLGAKYPEYNNEIMDVLNLTEFKDRHPMSLSEGQKQRVAIASALLSGKKLIIFDEPTSGLDYFHMEQFGRLLQGLKKSKTVIIVITHDEELASKWCDSVIELGRTSSLFT